MQEYIAHSWYEYADGDDAGAHPWEGETKFNYTGPKPPYEHLNVDEKYSWLKTPRWKDHPMEVGPLARHAGRLRVRPPGGEGRGRRHAEARSTCRWRRCSRRSAARRRAASRRSSSPAGRRSSTASCSRTSRTATRGCSTARSGIRRTWPAEAKGVGMSEAPRGALAHWIVIKERQDRQLPARRAEHVERLAARREGAAVGVRGGAHRHADRDPEQPLEVLRTIHSFDPCLACAVHLYDERGTLPAPGRRCSEGRAHGNQLPLQPGLRVGAAGPRLPLGERGRGRGARRDRVPDRQPAVAWPSAARGVVQLLVRDGSASSTSWRPTCSSSTSCSASTGASPATATRGGTTSCR